LPVLHRTPPECCQYNLVAGAAETAGAGQLWYSSPGSTGEPRRLLCRATPCSPAAWPPLSPSPGRGLPLRPPAPTGGHRRALRSVGWVNEPPYAAQFNRLELDVFNTETKEPVDGLQDTLKFTVEYGGQSVEIPLRPVADGEEAAPGAYTADILPTVRGVYTFHFTGTINEPP
jgi:hypothetical protein